MTHLKVVTSIRKILPKLHNVLLVNCEQNSITVVYKTTFNTAISL